MDKETKKEMNGNENEEKNVSNKEVLHEDNDGNYRYRGFWSGFGDQ